MLFQNSQRGSSTVITGIIAAILLGVGIFVWFNRTYIGDQITVWQFKPSESVLSLVKKTTMTDKGKFHFYAAQPEIKKSDDFNKVCQRQEENNAILGCFAGGRVYIYDITDERLKGVDEVTAAHEMLHVVYQRLSEGEKKKVNRLVMDEYKNLSGNKALANRIAYYNRTEPGNVNNELHSILGTEFDELSPELEAHYKEYFKDRKVIVAAYKNYSSVFNELKERSETIIKEIKQLATQIEADTKTFKATRDKLEKQIKSFNTRADSGDFSDEYEFNNQRNALVLETDKLEANRQKINENIKKHDGLVKEYNQVATTTKQLYESLDSQLSPIQKVE